MYKKIELPNSNKSRLGIWAAVYILLLPTIYLMYIYSIVDILFLVVAIYLCIPASISTVVASWLLWPFKIQITEEGIIFLYKHIDNKVIPWKNVIDIKASKLYYMITYTTNGKKNYFAPTYKNTLIIKQEWEKWKARRKNT